MKHDLFESREEAGRRLAARLHDVDLVRPIVLAIPRGGVEVGAPLALALGAELDVVLSRKLRAPRQPELAVGSVSESGDVYLGPFANELTGTSDDYLQREVAYQIAELERQTKINEDIIRWISIRVDEDILDYFKHQGAGYQRRMNAVLRSYVEQKRKTPARRKKRA